MANNIIKINPLTPMQSGMLYHSLLNNTGTNYYQQMCFYLEGQLCPETLRRAWQKVIELHEIFRTNFIWRGVKTPVQVVQEKRDAEFTILDISDLGPGSTEQAEYILRFKEADLEQRFDFEKGRLNRWTIIRLSTDRYYVCWTFHHILLDGWSGGIVLGELFHLYQCLTLGMPLPLAPRATFSDYLEWLKRQNLVKGLEFWRDALKNFTEPTLVPADQRATTGGATITHAALSTHEWDTDRTARLLEFCKVQNITTNAFIQTAWGILLQKYTNTRESCAGMTVSGRPAELPGVESIVGLFINTLPVLISTEAETTVGELLGLVNEQLVNARRYEYVSLAEIQKLFPGVEKMFNSLVVFENYPLDAVEQGGGLAALGLKLELDTVFELTTFDICLEVVLAQKTLLRLNYNRDTFLPETAGRILNHLELILESMLANPGQKVAELELVQAEERRLLIQGLNNTRAMYPKAQTVHQLFEAQAQRTPEAPAIYFNGQRLTYRELNTCANQLAHLLRRKGAKPDGVVGLMVERSMEMIVGILAILKAGGAYLPIDPEYPAARIAYMLGDSQPALLLTQQKLCERLDLTGSFAGEIIEVGRLWSARGKATDSPVGEGAVASDLPSREGGNDSEWVLREDAIAPDSLLHDGDLALDSFSREVDLASLGANLSNITRPENLLYVIYTSGSTGKPKGVMLEHRNLVNLLSYQFTRTNVPFRGRTLQFNTISFDVSFQEIFTTLLTGGELYLVTRELKEDLPGLFNFIEEHRINVLYLPATLVKFVFGETDLLWRFPRSVEHLITAGEQLIVSDNLRKYLEANKVHLHNHYGPSETHVVTALTIDPAEEIAELPSIGRPISNTQVYILNQDGCLQPRGIAGEMYIGGDSVGRGYLGRPDLTARRFTPNPFQPGGRLYRTGDLARWLPDGTLEFLGRVDQQVKIRGFRIELGEIESQILNHAAIKAAAVIARATGVEQYLVAYIVSEWEVPTSDLIAYLAQNLPDYMIPTYFVRLRELPLTPSGKVDRRALPEPELKSEAATFIAPATPGEEALAKIWAEILGLRQVGREDNFFTLGGHSLKATQLVSRIFKEFNVEVPLKVVFETGNLRELAAFIEGGSKKGFTAIGPVEKRDYYPVSSAQKRLYFMAKFEGNGITYNIPTVALMEGRLDEARLTDTFRKLIKRHEPLRTAFKEVDGEIVQVIAEEVEFAIEMYEQSSVEPLCEGQSIETSALMPLIQQFVRPFDLARAPLIRVGLVRLSAEKFLFMVDIHHIVADGLSLAVFFRELAGFYAGETLPPLRIQYKDFAHWQNQIFASEAIKAQEEYWLANLSGDLPVLDLPTDCPRPAEKSSEGNRYDFQLDSELAAKVQSFTAHQGVTLYMLLLAAYNVLLARYSGQEDIIIASPTAGRRHADLDNLLGMFVNTVPMRNHPIGKLAFRQFLARVKANTVQAFDNQDYQFDVLVEKLNLQRDLSRSPLCDVSFGLQNIDNTLLKLPELTLRPVNFTGNIAKFDLSLAAFENAGEVHLGIEYCTRLFRLSTIERIANHLTNLLSAAITNPDSELGKLQLLSVAEKRQILVEFNHTKEEYPTRTLHELFTEQALRTPDALALNVHGQRLTYGELNTLSDQLGKVLQKKGVKPGAIVALIAEYSMTMAIAIFGVLKAGGAYLPIDPESPAERIKFMLNDAGVKLLLIQAGCEKMDTLQPLLREVEILRLNSTPTLAEVSQNAVTQVFRVRAGSGIALTWQAISESHQDTSKASSTLAESDFEGAHLASLKSFAAPTDLAYVIYTSGSTGQPKGVQIEHRNIVNTATWRQREFALGYNDRVMPLFSYAFDGFVGGFFAALIAGSAVVLPANADAKDPFAVAALLRQEQISHLICVPTLYGVLLDYLTAGDIPALKTITLGGEAVNPEFLRRTRELSDQLELVNEYGPTENSVTTTCKRQLQRESQVTIGRPIANTQIYILDGDGQIVPTGVAGEICLSGSGLARGYLNRPDVTQEKFTAYPASVTPVADSCSASYPTATENRLYHTGDLGRWLPTGEIEFLGRVDRQVKIRGYRIELDEIEQKLLLHPAVKNAAVLERTNAAGESFLTAYVVYREPLANEDLRQALTSELPEYMMPSIIVDLPELPLTATGKINRKALPEPSLTAVNPVGEYHAPATPLEAQLAQLWSDLLGVTRVGRTDNFFTLGGHSLKAIALLGQIQQAFNMQLPLREIMKNPTIRQLAQYISSTQKAISGAPEENLILLRESTQHGDSKEMHHLFFIHDGSGEVNEYLALAEKLPSTITCWGIRVASENLNGGNELALEDLARDYLHKIKSVQPAGPYNLAGWSIGGSIVFEMVNQLEQEGEQVMLAALFDTLPPATQIPVEEVAATDVEMAVTDVKVAVTDAEMAVTGAKIAVTDAEMQGVNLLTLQLLVQARDQYIPRRPIQTRLLYFAATSSDFGASQWNNYCLNPISRYDIVGDHFTMFKEPAVHRLAEILTMVMQQRKEA